MKTKYILWLREIHGESQEWEEQGDGPLTLKTAERIAHEIAADSGYWIKTKILPVGIAP